MDRDLMEVIAEETSHQRRGVQEHLDGFRVSQLGKPGDWRRWLMSATTPYARECKARSQARARRNAQREAVAIAAGLGPRPKPRTRAYYKWARELRRVIDG